MDLGDPIKVLFFPGKNMPLKRYTAYFRGVELMVPDKLDTKINVIVCHSRGIDDAIKIPNIPIIAIDPSSIPDEAYSQNRVIYIWIRAGREYIKAVDTRNNIIIVEYKEQTHYPYELAKIRDDIIKKIKLLNYRSRI
jgi:hypothetical protein